MVNEMMELEHKKVLVIGAAVSGIPAVRFLASKGAEVTLNDSKKVEDLESVIAQLKGVRYELAAGDHPLELAGNCDFAVVSPGVPLDLPIINELRRLGKEIIGEIELGYRFAKAPILAVTGTNGKTTTTALLGEIMEKSGRRTFITGNIGNALVGEVDTAKEKDIFVTEVSSFQLESIQTFRPHIGAILNITPDHLDRHKTMEGYTEAKLRLFENQGENDYGILNWDCPETKALKERLNSRVLFFSRKDILGEGAWVEEGAVWVSLGGDPEFVVYVDEIFVPGQHNLENVLAAALMAYCAGVLPQSIGNSIREFKGVEHRIEFVAEFNGIAYYNDSKGTNSDASIKAIEAMKRDIVLIAGGYDKEMDFTDFIQAINGKVKRLVLLGETRERLARTADENGYKEYVLADSFEQAVETAISSAMPGDCVLLSPACASWDMFPNYEVRGRVFKELVLKHRPL